MNHGQHIDAEDDGAKGAEDVGHRIAHGDVALQCLDLLQRQVELGDGGAGGADDGGLGHGAGGDPRGDALVEAEQPGAGDDGQQAAERHHRGQDDLAQRLPTQGAKELRSALEAYGVDEQREEHRLDAVVDADADLADDHRHQQRAGDPTQLELAELDAADPVTDGQGQEQGQFRCLIQDLPQVFHGSRLRPGIRERNEVKGSGLAFERPGEPRLHLLRHLALQETPDSEGAPPTLVWSYEDLCRHGPKNLSTAF